MFHLPAHQFLSFVTNNVNTTDQETSFPESSFHSFSIRHFRRSEHARTQGVCAWPQLSSEPGRMQRGPTIPRAPPWRLRGATQRDIHPQESAAFRGGERLTVSLALLLASPAARPDIAPPVDLSGDARLLPAVGGQRRAPWSPHLEELPLASSGSCRLPGARSPLANTPLQPKQPLKPAAPATGPGQWGKLTAVATGRNAQLSSSVGHGQGGDEPVVSAPGSGGECPGERSASRGEDCTPIDGSRTGYRWRSPLPLVPTPRTRRPGPAERLPERVTGAESKPATAGAAEGGGLCARGRELESALCAGCRQASGPGLRSATAAPPPLRLPEQSAPRRGAPRYK